MKFKENRGVILIVTASVLVVALIVAGVMYLQKLDAQKFEGLSVESTSEVSYTVYTDKSAPTITIYEDPACPYCKQLENTASKDLLAQVKEGNLQITYKPVTILDANSPSGEYSSLILGAYHSIMEVDDNGEAFNRFHEWVYAKQPPHGAELSVEKIAEGMKKAGASEEAMEFFTQETNWQEKLHPKVRENVDRIYSQIQDVRVPYVEFEGRTLDITNSDWVDDLIEGL